MSAATIQPYWACDDLGQWWYYQWAGTRGRIRRTKGAVFNCECCGASSQATVSNIREGRGRFCSRTCGGRNRPLNYTRRDHHLYNKYRIRQVDFDGLSAQQGGACAICSRVVALLHVDHDHVSGLVRGLLCPTCNVTLGKFEDDPAKFRRAADYLERGAASKAGIEVES